MATLTEGAVPVLPWWGRYCPMLWWGIFTYSVWYIYLSLRILTPIMETPDPPNDTPGALKQVVLTPHDIPWSLRDIHLVQF